MTPDTHDHSAADHEIEGEHSPAAIPLVGNVSNTAGVPLVPLAEPIPVSVESPVELIPSPEVPIDSGQPFPGPPRERERCLINLRAGCYRITFEPESGPNFYRGSMRVDIAGGSTTISGDLYRFLDLDSDLPSPLPFPLASRVLGGIGQAEIPTTSQTILSSRQRRDIPIYARNQYHSYLKVTNIQQSPMFTSGPCRLTLTAEEYVYTQPPAGSFNGTFPATPTRTVTIVLKPKRAPAGFTSSYFKGTLFEGGTERGDFTMGWVSSSFRKATLEIDTLTGAVAPQAVPASSGSGTEDFRTVLATAGWDLNVVVGQTNVPVPAGVNPNTCWSSADLHALMLAVRDPATNIDTEWRMHLVVVPATMGCGRGVMYDQIAVPREGVASFSDDGYPSSDSGNFGTAADQQQRNVLRAFLRSASHEVGHGFNQIHQEQEAGADNSIMTTTPSVADVLGGPTTGAPGVFPDNINLGFNDHVRHHLVHFPDIVVRPGGMTFGSGHSSVVPEADRQFFSEQELELRLEPVETQIELGEPLQLAWTLINRSEAAIPVPSDVRIEAQHAFITVTDPSGTPKPMPSFVIETDSVSIESLDPGQERQAKTQVFWSSRGFAFETPGRHILEVRITWTYGGVPFGVRTSTDIWVNYPQSTTDNDAAATLLNPEVGMYVALGGGASHLREAVSRLESVQSMGVEVDQPRPQALRGYEGLLPSDREETSDEEQE
jgi:hypothetical protein